MKRIYSAIKAAMLAACLILLFIKTNAGTITSTSTGGNWSATSTWVGGVVPASTDNVVIATGANVTANQNYAAASGGVLKVNGTLTIPGNGTVSLLNFTSIIITCPGQIYWSQNANLVFSAGTTVEVNGYTNGSLCGLQPTGGSASAALVIGGITIAVSNDNSNNAAYSFDQFNKAGGLAAFTLLGNTPVCYSSSFTVTLTPTDNITNFDCKWSVDQSGSISPTTVSGFTSAQTATITPTNSSTAKTYTITCTVYRHGDSDPIVAKTFSVTVNPSPTASAALSATPCVGSSATFNATTTNTTTYQWQISTDGGTSWTNLNNTAPYSGVTTSALGVNPTSVSLTSNYYRVKASNGFQDYTSTNCSASSASTIIKLINEWQGTSSTNWSTNTNWVNNTLPVFNTGCPTAVIPAVSTLPQLPAGTTVVTNLSVASGAYVDLNGNNLEIDGAFSGSSTGYLKGNSSSGLIIGGAAGNLYFGSANNILKTLTINNSASATLGNSLNIVAGTFASPGTLSVNGTLDANGNLTLKSDANGTARVASSTTGAITNNVTVERYIPARRAWRFLSVPFKTSTQYINNAWQESATPNPDVNTQNNPNPGYGTEITYDNNTSHGFDVNGTYNPSLKVWDYSTKAWSTWAPNTLITYITDYPAYCLFVRGSRAIKLSLGTGATPDNTILRATGVLNEPGTGLNSLTKSYSGTAGDLIFAGNPYASSINLGTVLDNSTGISGTRKFWTWDPRKNGLYGVGGYVAYSNNVQVPADTSYQYTTGNIIQSGQAFFVQASGSSSSIKFQQSDKSSSEGNVFGLTGSHQEVIPVIYTNLMIPQDNTMALTDGVGAGFGDRFAAAVDDDDAQKLWNFDENIALVRGTSTLAIEFRPTLVLTDTLFYRLYLRQQPYTLQIFTKDFEAAPLMRAWMVDKYLNTQTEINLQDTTLYSFTPNPDTLSYRNRFMLVLRRQLLTTPVPVSKTTNLNNPNIIGLANSVAESAVGITVYPDPVTDIRNASLRFTKMPRGNYQVIVYDANGKRLFSQKIEDNGGTNFYPLEGSRSQAAGVYTVTVTSGNLEQPVNLKLVINK